MRLRREGSVTASRKEGRSREGASSRLNRLARPRGVPLRSADRVVVKLFAPSLLLPFADGGRKSKSEDSRRPQRQRNELATALLAGAGCEASQKHHASSRGVTLFAEAEYSSQASDKEAPTPVLRTPFA